MKYSLLFILFLAYRVDAVLAQDFSHPLSGISKVVIHSENEVRVISHKLPGLLISERENIRNKKPERAKGLEPLNSRGVDNTGMGVEVKQEG